MNTDLSKHGVIDFWDTDTQPYDVEATSPEFYLQRVASETGTLHVEVDSVMTTASGNIHLEGRLSPDHGWADLALRSFSDLVAVSSQKSINTVDVPLAPYVRISLTNNTPNKPAGGKINVRLGF